MHRAINRALRELRDSIPHRPLLGWHDHGRTADQPVPFRDFRKYDLPLPVIHKGWFENTLPTELPAQIAFAHLDGDFYSSIAVSLRYVYPKMSKARSV